MSLKLKTISFLLFRVFLELFFSQLLGPQVFRQANFKRNFFIAKIYLMVQSKRERETSIFQEKVFYDGSEGERERGNRFEKGLFLVLVRV